MLVDYPGAMAGTGAPLVDPLDDVGLLCGVLAAAINERIVARMADEGYDDVRTSHGYVFQGLLAGDRTVTELAHRLGVSVQAVSKSVQELEGAGYLRRARDDHDGRARRVALTERAEAMLAVSRQARLEVADAVTEQLGPRNARAFVRHLRGLCEQYGALDDITTRRVRPAHGLD
jgi:DNA-binding MarR family transcriptional regulator